jgi:phytoene synthase
MGWLMLAMLRAGGSMILPGSPVIYARALPETEFLVRAAAQDAPRAADWSDTLYEALARLKAQDIERESGLSRDAGRVRETA